MQWKGFNDYLIGKRRKLNKRERHKPYSEKYKQKYDFLIDKLSGFEEAPPV